jgi:hypothetical protein
LGLSMKGSDFPKNVLTMMTAASSAATISKGFV